LADAGYFKDDNLSEVESRGSMPCIAIQKQPQRERLEHLIPHEDGKSYSCLAGYKLPSHAAVNKIKNQSGIIIFINAKNCENCLHSGECRLFSSRGKKLHVATHDKRELVIRHLKRSRTEAYKELYKRRKAIVEPVFANLKTQKNLKIFVVGKKKVNTWWKMICTAHNIEKIISFMTANPLFAY
jgi:hypothetical protein